MAHRKRAVQEDVDLEMKCRAIRCSQRARGHRSRNSGDGRLPWYPPRRHANRRADAQDTRADFDGAVTSDTATSVGLTHREGTSTGTNAGSLRGRKRCSCSSLAPCTLSHHAPDMNDGASSSKTPAPPSSSLAPCTVSHHAPDMNDGASSSKDTRASDDGHRTTERPFLHAPTDGAHA